MTVASDHTLAGDTRREEVRPRHQPSRLTWRRHRYWILTILGLFVGAHLISGFYVVPLYYLPETWLARARDIVLPARMPRYFLSNEVLARRPAPPAPGN